MISTKDMNKVWDDLLKYDYNQVLKTIEKHPEIVNAIHPDKNSLFTMILNTAKKEKSPEALIKCIIKQDQFELHNTGCVETNIEAIISLAQLDVIKLLENDSRLVFSEGNNKKNLTYSCIKNSLEEALNMYNEDYNKNPNSKNTAFSKVYVDDLKEMLDILHSATIRLAVKEDNVDLLKKLEQEGGRASDFREGKKQIFTADLLTKNNTKLVKFFEEKRKYFEQKRNEESLKEKEKIKLIDKEIEQVKEKYLKNQEKLIDGSIAKKNKLIGLFANKKNQTNDTVDNNVKNTKFSNE